MRNKSILMSIQPKWVAKILNGEKTIEVRKKFPKDYVGWVYIYCTKDQGRYGETQLLYNFKTEEYFIGKDLDNHNHNDICYLNQNGKVVARFWCDKVEEIAQAKLENGVGYDYIYDTDTLLAQNFYKKSCLENWDLLNYFGYKYKNGEIVGYAIHISKLEVFDKPMLTTMFRKPEYRDFLNDSKPNRMSLYKTLKKYSLSKAPQSWQFIEGE